MDANHKSNPYKDLPKKTLNNEFLLAAQASDVTKMKLLLEANADVNTRQHFGLTALMHVACIGHMPSVQLLISNKASLDIRSECGMEALTFAVTQGHTSIVKYFIENNAKTDVKNSADDSLLDLAANKGHLDIVKILIAQGVKVNPAKILLRKTPLMHAAHHGHLHIVKFLITKGADINAVDSLRYTACMYADKNRQFHVSLYLKSYPLVEKMFYFLGAGIRGHLPLAAKCLNEQPSELFQFQLFKAFFDPKLHSNINEYSTLVSKSFKLIFDYNHMKYGKAILPKFNVTHEEEEVIHLSSCAEKKLSIIKK